MDAILCLSGESTVQRLPGAKRGPMALLLFQRDDCHLCDLALAVLAEVRAPEFDSVFIDGEPRLEDRYGLRVPVLLDASSGRELDWPFDAVRLRNWLQG